MLNKTTHKNSFMMLWLIVFVILISIITSPLPNVISWDVFGYYLYLPGLFIYNDLGFNDWSWIDNIVEIYNSTDTVYQISKGPLGNNINKYSMGMAFLYLPFFLIAHALSFIFNYLTDGFSLLYQLTINIGSFCYFVIGLFYLRKVLLHFYNDKIVATTLFFLCFGTNYFHIEVFNGAMPHNYLFALYALLLWLTIKWNKCPTLKNSIFLGLIIGLITLVRPTEIICVLIPLIFGVFSWKTLRNKVYFLFQNYKLVLIVFVFGLVIGAAQLIYWKIFAGSFVYYSYNNNGEGLDFTSPHITNVLFSFRKGWIVYTPIMGFAIIGLYFLYKKHKKWFLPILFFLFLTYI